MTHIWMLSLNGEEKVIYKVAETLGFLEDSDAVAVSVFEKPEHHTVEALYDTQEKAELAKNKVGGNVTRIEDRDWVSETQSGLHPVEAKRFFIHGSHDADKIPSNAEFSILIDAGMAFGTGHHGTTKGCLLIFDQLLEDNFQPRTILDLGCGAGILAIAAAKALPKSKIFASDVDQDAVDVTLDNAKFNQVSDSINSFKADGFDSPSLARQQFDLIFANILAGPLMVLAPHIFDATSKNGKVILSGILDEQALTVKTTFESVGFTIEDETHLEGWSSLLAKKV